MAEPLVEYATVRNTGYDWHIECRMSDGQKGAFVQVDASFPELADWIAHQLTHRVAATELSLMREAAKALRDAQRYGAGDWHDLISKLEAAS